MFSISVLSVVLCFVHLSVVYRWPVRVYVALFGMFFLVLFFLCSVVLVPGFCRMVVVVFVF